MSCVCENDKRTLFFWVTTKTKRLSMKSILTLATLGCLFGAALFVAIVMGAVLAHFTNAILGGVATFPFAVMTIQAVRWAVARAEGRQQAAGTQAHP
tara:strand:- start:2705 stop:2995 length:291 start_codon:yes stop_codon:yes gene_type:complete